VSFFLIYLVALQWENIEMIVSINGADCLYSAQGKFKPDSSVTSLADYFLNCNKI